MKSVIIIPARYGSSRYKGKPLVKILNREMVLRVADICLEVVNKKDLYIATDSIKISKIVKRANYKVLMTSFKCLTGTDRVAEAAKKVKSQIYVNVQGDEPTINPNDIKKIINEKIKYPNHVICGYDEIHKNENPSNLNLPKIVINEKKELIYMSRSLVPGNKKKIKNSKYFKQVCIYAFNKKELSKFYSKKKKSLVEKIEDIEILRFFDLDIKIKMVKLNSNSIAVDEFKDVKKAEKLLKRRLSDIRKKY
jgi:3-deoxy-manno-octulosonate cytidylyltransferase (CMP-KDO synthetase)